MDTDIKDITQSIDQPWQSSLETQMVNSLTCANVTIMNLDATQYKTTNIIFQDEPEETDLAEKLFSRFYINLPGNKRKLWGTIDNGSDISLIHVDLINQMFSESEINKYKQPPSVVVHSYTNTEISIIYEMNLPCQFVANTNNVNINFRIFRNLDAFPILIGQDAMRPTKMVISYNPPSVEIFYPIYASLPTVSAPPQAALTCSSLVSLDPRQSKNIIFKPHKLCYIQKSVKVLIEDSSDPRLHIIPTRYSAYSKPSIPFIACVTNLTNEQVKIQLTTKIKTMQNFEFLDKNSPTDSFSSINNIQHTALPYQWTPNLPALTALENLPKSNTKTRQTVKACLLLTPYQSKNLQPTKTEEQTKDTNNEEDTNFTEQINNIPVKPDNRPNSPPLEMPPDLLQPSGYSIPCNLQPTVIELLNIEQYDEEHRPYIEDIFVHKYPTIVALHSFDIGDISRTLGYYTIKLKDNETLPTFRKIYFMNSLDTQQMLDITNFLIKFNVISRASHQDEINHLHASAGYLVQRQNKLASPRLVIDYTLINQIIKTSPPNIPSITSVLQSLRDKAIFSSIDLTSAFYSIQLSPECRHLTRFATQTGSYIFKCLPMGLSLSPMAFAEVSHRMIHMSPVLNSKGEPNFIKENVIEMKNDVIEGVHIFYDDVLMTSPMYPTHAETIKEHYKVVEKVMERLAYHRAKISLEKSKFGKYSIKFLGWIISNNLLLPDPARTKKLLATPFPTNIKAMRSFLGLINTLRTALPHTFLNEINVLNPLCSSTTPYNPDDSHKEAFERLKSLLTTTPVYSNIIDPKLKKLLFVDASDKGSYSAVLCQLVPPKTNTTKVPTHLILDDPVDRIIFAFNLCFYPVPLYLHDEFIPRSQMNPPYQILHFKNPSYLEEDFLGYTDKTVKNSFYYAVRSVQFAYGNSLMDISQIKPKILEKLKKSIIKYKILEKMNNDQNEFNNFIKQLENNIIPIDRDFLIITLIAQILSRPIFVISALPEHSGNQLIKYENQIQKPPIILGVQEKNKNIIFRPYFINKHSSFSLEDLQDTLQIVTFWSKAISPKDYHKDIALKELYCIVAALAALKPLIGQSDLLLLTDSRPLFLLYSNPVSQSSSKLCRWGLKISSEYHNLKMRFISTKNNIADFLTRDYNAKPTDIIRLPLKELKIENLDNLIDPNKEFTIEEWKQFVNDNQKLLIIPEQPSNQVSVSSLTTIENSMKNVLDPLEHLHKRMSYENIIKEQEKEFKSILNFLVTQPDMEGTKLGKSYKIENGMLYSFENEQLRVLLPETLEGIFIAFIHLSHNHLGVKGMTSALKYFDFPQKTKKIKQLAERCYACSLQNVSTRKNVLGFYPTPEYPFQFIHLDLMENLPANRRYEHILLVVCPLTKFLMCYPLRDKTSTMIIFHLIHNIYQFANIQYIISDNGPCFSSKEFLTVITALNIKKIRLSALHPQSNGLAEAHIKKVKTILKKTCTTTPEYQWLDALPLLIKQFNTTKNAITNLSPLQIIHGEDSINAEKYITSAPPNKIYPLIENIKSQVERKYEQNKQILEFVKNEIHMHKVQNTQKLNVKRHTPEFEVGDYIFVKDRAIVQGTTRPLKSLYDDTPWTILRTNPTSALIRRLGDGLVTLYSYDDLKKYNPLDPTFSHLPQEVRSILVNKFENLNKNHYHAIRKYGSFQIPDNDPLYEIENSCADMTAENITPISPVPAKPAGKSKEETDKILTSQPQDVPKAKIRNSITKRITRSMANKKDSDSEDSEAEPEVKTVKFK